jgi:hypothetical protein
VDEKEKEVAAILTLLLVAIAGFAYVGVIKLSVTPSFEGPHFIFIGLQPPGSSTVYVANSNTTSLCLANSNLCGFVQSTGSNGQVDTYYSWQYDQTHTTITANTVPGGQSCGTSVDIKPAIQTPTQISSVSYVSKSSGYQASGAVYESGAQLALFTQGNINCHFSGEILWFAIVESAWNNVNEGGPTNGATWSTPLLLEYLGTPTPPAQGGTVANNYQTNPGTTSGIEPLTLYSIPQTSSSFGGLLSDPSGAYAVNSTLASKGILYPGPSTQMLQYGFFPVVLTDFGPFGCGTFDFYECDNTLQLSFNLYSLQLGTYTWSNPVTSTQTTNTNNCGSGCFNWGSWLQGIFTNPFAWLAGLFALGSGAVIVILLIILGPTGLLLLLSRRKKGDEDG